MSRSRKKNPIDDIACCKAQNVREMKRINASKERRFLDKMEDLPKGGWYKKRCHSWCWWPSDGRRRVDKESKYARK